MGSERKLKVGISIGDINGIGPEIVLKAFEDPRMLELFTPVIFASSQVIASTKKLLDYDIHFHGIHNLNEVVDQKVNVFNVWKENIKIELGKEDPQIGSYAIKSLEAAVTALKDGAIDVLVTAPINKSNIQSESFNFPGHTDYLAKELKGKSLMLMVSGKLRVGLLTDHLPVREVSNAITPALIQDKINTISHTLKQDFAIEKPVIAVLSINPHAGDKGVIGNEDDAVLKPTLEKLRNQGILVYGPYSADSFFGSGNYKNFDAVIASYHDQGLIPFKTLAFGKGVNFTAGLSKIRTSPDHGTAYEIAGKNQADPSSFIQAIFTGIEIFKNRKTYLKFSSDPLKKLSKRR